MGAEIRTRTGRICHRLEKGVYRVSGTGEMFKSQEEPKIDSASLSLGSRYHGVV